MTTNPTMNQADLFARYESALTGLANVPSQLEKDVAKARAVYDMAISTAVNSAKRDGQRLDLLRQNITTRFSSSAQSLRDANVLVPHRLRAAAGQKGDASSLTAAINAQYEAEKAVVLELQAAAIAAKLQAGGDRSRRAASQAAAAALRRRQEEIRKARGETQAKAGCKRVETEKQRKQQRQVMIAGGVGLLSIVTILVALLF